jgi:small subunit ribosomal protein S8
MYTDPIADYLTRVRNAVMANHKVVEIPASNLKKEITKILFDQGYILSYKFEDSSVQGTIKIALKYDKDTKESVIKDIQRIPFLQIIVVIFFVQWLFVSKVMD